VDKQRSGDNVLTAELYELAVDIAVERLDFDTARSLVMIMASNGTTLQPLIPVGVVAH
jgi:hypothetical protein